MLFATTLQRLPLFSGEWELLVLYVPLLSRLLLLLLLLLLLSKLLLLLLWTRSTSSCGAGSLVHRRYRRHGAGHLLVPGAPAPLLIRSAGTKRNKDKNNNKTPAIAGKRGGDGKKKGNETNITNWKKSSH